jgi:hypothetical protein
MDHMYIDKGKIKVEYFNNVVIYFMIRLIIIIIIIMS